MARPTAAVLITGSELLLGLIADRNTEFLARELDALGLDLRRVLTVGDAQDDIVAGLRTLAGHDLLITSGGLGPTHDDRTVAAVAEAAGVPLELDADTLRHIDERMAWFARERGLDPAGYAEGNRKQAHVPRGADVLTPIGSAPGVLLPVDGALVAVLPGPPSELQRMWRDLQGRRAFAALVDGVPPLERRLLRVFGLGESNVADAFARAGGDDGGTVTTICARRLEVEVLVRAEPDRRDALETLVAGLRERLGAAIFSEDERPLEELVLDLYRTAGARVGTAESCTAGQVSARLAAIPGASDVLAGAVVAYANEIKRDVLGVPQSVLEQHGAVSPECAAMAAGARRVLDVDASVAVTGIAGPGGGTPEKPVGLVYLHASGPGGERAQRLVLPGGRSDVQAWSATAALHLLRQVAHPAPPSGPA